MGNQFFCVVFMICWIRLFSHEYHRIGYLCSAFVCVSQRIFFCAYKCIMICSCIVLWCHCDCNKISKMNWIDYGVDQIELAHSCDFTSSSFTATNTRRWCHCHYHYYARRHIKIWMYTIPLTFYDSIAIRSNWNDMVNRRVLNKMGVKYFQMVSFHIGRERQRIVFHWNRSRIMRTKCECQRILSIITLDALLCSSASFFVFLVVRSESRSIVFSALSFPVLLSQIIRVAYDNRPTKRVKWW